MMVCCHPHEEEAAGETLPILPPPPSPPASHAEPSPQKKKRKKLSKKVVVSVIACFSWVSMGGLQGLLGPAIPAIATQLAVPDTALGWAFSVRAGGYIAGSLLISRLTDDGPSKVMVMACAGVLASVVNLVIPYSTVLLVLLALCFLQGIGLSIISTLGNIVLLDLWGHKAGPWLQGLHFSFGIGAILSSLILGVAGMATSFFVFACVGIVPLLAVLLVEGLPSLQRSQFMDELREEEEEEEEEGWPTRQVVSNSTKDMHTIVEGEVSLFPPTGAGGVGEEGGGEKEDPLSISSSQRIKRLGHGSRGKRLSMTIMPFQETVMAVPVEGGWVGESSFEALVAKAEHQLLMGHTGEEVRGRAIEKRGERKKGCLCIPPSSSSRVFHPPTHPPTHPPRSPSPPTST